MIVLDTNVLSELMRPAPAKSVERWVASHSAMSLFTTTITQSEIFYGVALLPRGRRRATLEELIESMWAEDFAGRVLPFDTAATRAFASIAASRRKAGKPIAQLDAQIAAISRSRNAAVATRNVADFEGCGVVVHNPWRD